MAHDRSILRVKELSNDLEAYAYEMRSSIEQYGNLEKYVDPQVKDSFIAQLN